MGDGRVASHAPRASREELRLDYEDVLRHRGLPIWQRTDPRRAERIARRCATAAAAVLAGALLPAGGCRRDEGPTANTTVQDASAPGEFLGNEANKVVHRMDCAAANNISPLYRETFPR